MVYIKKNAAPASSKKTKNTAKRPKLPPSRGWLDILEAQEASYRAYLERQAEGATATKSEESAPASSKSPVRLRLRGPKPPPSA